MSLRTKLTEDMKAAMKAKDTDRLATIRLLLSEVKNEEINTKDSLSEEDELAFLSTQAKRRRESIDAYEEAGRQDLAQREAAELAIIQEYLPKQLSEDEAETIVREVVDETGAQDMSDLGKVMGALMPRLKGQFPGQKAREIVQKVLS